jgi:hypothetical protein
MSKSKSNTKEVGCRYLTNDYKGDILESLSVGSLFCCPDGYIHFDPMKYRYCEVAYQLRLTSRLSQALLYSLYFGVGTKSHSSSNG